jgi:TolB-like protein
MPGVSKAVFLSYASEDAEAAERIATALRAAGIEVWFDQSELRGGDAWDQSIRKQIKNCALFVPLISQHTHERAEGYFRLEWKLAVDRSHLIMTNKAFLVPVVVDDTGDDDENVPEQFRELQWTRLPAGETPSEFATRIGQLLSQEAGASPPLDRGPAAVTFRVWSRFGAAWFALAVMLAAVISYLVIEKPWAARLVPVAAFVPPAHSIAVLPFVNISGDPSQEYFSDGLTEELLNSLAAIEGLQVAARTSSFSFKEHPDIITVAHKLNVGAVLEGSVRRSEHTVRVTAQLINASTGFHLWSKTYDRDLGDVLKLQTEIATSVAAALRVTLLGNVSHRIELGGTSNPAAFDTYLRALKAFQSRHEDKEVPTAIAAYTEAIRLDPDFALAFAGRSYALTRYAGFVAAGSSAFEARERAQSDASRAIALAPELAAGHVALAYLEFSRLDFAGAGEAFARALALAPGDAQVLRATGTFDTFMGHLEAGIADLRRVVTLDPLNHDSHFGLGHALYFARRYQAATISLGEAIKLNPEYERTYGFLGLAFYGLGDLKSARASCETKRDDKAAQFCLAVVYDKLGRHSEAENELKKQMAAGGDAGAYQYALIYAQWGNRPKALEWLEKAMRLRDGGLATLKCDPLADPLRNEPRFQVIERELKFPE